MAIPFSKKACDDAKDAVLDMQILIRIKTKEWRDQKTKCLKLHAPRKLTMCQFGTDLQNKCEKVQAHQNQMDLVNGAGNEFSHSDRVAEWVTTFKTKCLLRKIIEGKTLDTTASTECDVEAIYPKVLNKKDEAFAALTTEKQFTCSESTISFWGQNWDLPLDEEAPSEDYSIVDPFTRDVDIFAETPFAVCAPTPTCGGDAKGMPCLFPFTFQGTEHHSCIDGGFGYLWCPTNKDFGTNGVFAGWGKCEC